MSVWIRHVWVGGEVSVWTVNRWRKTHRDKWLARWLKWLDRCAFRLAGSELFRWSDGGSWIGAVLRGLERWFVGRRSGSWIGVDRSDVLSGSWIVRGSERCAWIGALWFVDRSGSGCNQTRGKGWKWFPEIIFTQNKRSFRELGWFICVKEWLYFFFLIIFLEFNVGLIENAN